MGFFSELFKKNNKAEILSVKTESNFPIEIIPEPTRSLLWVTNEDTSKIQLPMTFELIIEINSNNLNIKEEKHNFFAEPSLIWTRLPVKINNDLEEKPIYYPSYSGLSPEKRYQYLNWLKDVTKETNLSYVFLYFYGLERHLLVGNYDSAVDEILRLLEYHNKGTFRSYAIHSLIASSVVRKRLDIIERAPFILNDLNDLSLKLRRLNNRGITIEDLINLSFYVKFYNKRYLRTYPNLFKKELKNVLEQYENKNWSLLENFKYDQLPKDDMILFANTSIPANIRSIKIPRLLTNKKFNQVVYALLSEAHNRVKDIKNKKELNDSLAEVNKSLKNMENIE